MRYVCVADLKRIIFYLKNNLNQSYFKTQPNISCILTIQIKIQLLFKLDF